MQPVAGTRSYDSPLRREQAQGTRERVLDAAASEITESGDFVVAQVAKRAGVSVRTVYHHFPDREAMLDALAEWLNAQLGYLRPDKPESLASFVDEAIALCNRIDAEFEKVRAFFSIPGGQATRERARARRLEHLRRLAETELAGVDPKAADWAVVMIHQLASYRTWQVLKAEAGFDASDAAGAVRWAITTLLEDVKAAASSQDGA